MDSDMKVGFIESILFLESEPLDLSGLARITGFPKGVIKDTIMAIQNHYQSGSHGIELIQIGGGYLFAPKQNLWNNLKPHYAKKNGEKLSKAALETLSIIAYSQPITKAEIESIRGVAAEGMIKLLISRNLIKEVGKKESPGRPIQYGTTKEFLIQFRLSSIADLPKLDELDKDRFEINE